MDSHWKTARLAILFLLASLVALLLLPILVQRRAEHIRTNIVEAAAQARDLIEDVERSLAIQVAAERGYALSGSPRMVDRFRSAEQAQRSAFQALAPIARDLGPEITLPLSDLENALADWQRLPLLTRANAASARFDEGEDAAFQRAIAAAAALDEALSRKVLGARDEERRLERFTTATTVILSLLSLVSFMVLVWLSMRLRAFAADQRRRAEEEIRLREELQTVFASRERLLRGFSHDLRNPLGAADGYAELLERGLIQDEAKRAESLQRIRRSISSAVRLIDDLLDLARAESGQLELRISSVQSDVAGREIFDDFRAQAEAEGLRVAFETCDDPPIIETDPARLRQVLSNLMSNAIKYTPRGAQIGMRVLSTAARGVRYEVWDEGRGIPQELQQKIFQEFTRLEPTRAHGVGLGLAISRRIARSLGGDIYVESDGATGSTFIFEVPPTAPTASATLQAAD